MPIDGDAKDEPLTLVPGLHGNRHHHLVRRAVWRLLATVSFKWTNSQESWKTASIRRSQGGDADNAILKTCWRRPLEASL